MRIGITGGAGFVGGHLTTQLRAAGHKVEVFTRLRPADAAGLRGLGALIDAAWDFAAAEVNVGTSVRLFDTAKAAGISRLIFISSLSAFEGCRSRYGATKLEVEKHVAALGGCNVRLGFLCDDTTRGLSGSLKKLASLPMIPLPGGGKQNLFAIQAEDLGTAFLRLLNNCAGLTVNLAHPKPISLKKLMVIFARQQGRTPVFLPFPWRLLWVPLRLMEVAGLKLKFRSDSLVSLMNQDPSPDFRSLERLGIRLRAFGDRPAAK